METQSAIDDILKTFMAEIDALDDNTELALRSPSPTTSSKKRKRTTMKQKLENNMKPGWVPKPPDDCPVVSWTENKNIFTVQNPANNGQLLLKMELYNMDDMLFRCGLFLSKNSEVHNNVLHLVDKVENMWIDKPTGIPKINGLTQTVTQCASTSKPIQLQKKTSKTRTCLKKDNSLKPTL